MKNSKPRLPRVLNTKSYKQWKINQMKAGKTKLPDRIQPFGTSFRVFAGGDPAGSTCARGWNLQISTVTRWFFLFVDPCRFVIRAVRSRLNGSWRSTWRNCALKQSSLVLSNKISLIRFGPRSFLSYRYDRKRENWRAGDGERGRCHHLLPQIRARLI